MKNNLLDKEFIESDDIHDFLCLVDSSLFSWLKFILLYFIDFILQHWINPELSFLIFFSRLSPRVSQVNQI